MWLKKDKMFSYDILNKKTDLSPKQLIQDNKLITSPQDIADKINSTFLAKVKRIVGATSRIPMIDPVERLRTCLQKQNKSTPTLNLRPINKVILRRLVSQMKGGRSSGIDAIDSYSIKIAAPLIEDALLHLINLSIKNGFPSIWKTQLIHPLHKKGDKTNGENFRPVSHIAELSKLVEYAVLEQIMAHFEDNDLFHWNHHGFLPNRNTTTTILQIYDNWLKSAERKEINATVFIDMSSAFDVINHSILLQKLSLYGFSEEAVGFFRSYLANRVEVVQVQHKFSSPEHIGDQGITQGSSLGPVAFLVYMNDLPGHSEDGEAVLYADDDSEIVSPFSK